ncbi:ABC transporter permease [Accumulibacter sp.]|uniref:ABC transporter permease n=1 Tax=Accumulibacter sp. TaxID=2053492 RepID=UPI0025EBE4F4|nr:ABC transporter permease [Accumulibacter sp.]MCM8594487.1 ABC transporter permease [Accumulibacter sp.]MDS4048633.1 ABC transporter permease [Accumulibacter sp.]
MLKLALRNLFRNPGRTLMTLASIVFGVVSLILSGGFVQDVYEQLAEALIHSQSGHIQVSRAGFHARGTRNPENFLIEDPEGIRRTIRQQPGVADVMARISFSGLLSNGRTDWPIVGEGVEPEKEAALGSQLRITSGEQLAADQPNQILVGDGVARTLGLHTGDQVTVLLSTAEGALNSIDLRVVGTFQSFSSDFDARAVRIPLVAAQESLGTRGANSLVVALQQTDQTNEALRGLRQRIDTRIFEVLAWPELNPFYEGVVAVYERQFGVLQVIILLLVLISVANSVNMSAFERVGEFGTMMALGDRGGALFRLLVVENVLLGSGGALVGVVLAVLLALAISAIGIPMPPPPDANVGYTAHIRIVPRVLVEACLVGFSATVVAALLPAWRIARIPVAEALRQNQ